MPAAPGTYGCEGAKLRLPLRGRPRLRLLLSSRLYKNGSDMGRDWHTGVLHGREVHQQLGRWVLVPLRTLTTGRCGVVEVVEVVGFVGARRWLCTRRFAQSTRSWRARRTKRPRGAGLGIPDLSPNSGSWGLVPHPAFSCLVPLS